MKNNLVLFSIILLAILVGSCKKEKYHTDSQTEYDKEILEAVNAHRLSIGLTPFEHNEFLWQMANEHTENMANGDTPFGHEGLTERSERIRLQLGIGLIAENVATGQGTATEVVNSWLASIGHKLNIDSDFTLTGISAVQKGDGTWYYTQFFFKSNP